MKILGCFLLLLPLLASAFDYKLANQEDNDYGEISLTDVDVDKEDVATIFSGEITAAAVTGLLWEPNTGNNTGDRVIEWELIVSGKSVDSGVFNLTGVGRELPSSIDVGTFVVDDKVGNFVNVEVKLTLDGEEWTFSNGFKAYRPGVSMFPLVVVILLAVSTRMVELSLFASVFVGACMVEGEINEGFKRTLDNYLVGALSDEDHVYVILFTLFLSGLVGMLMKSGGMTGFTKDIAAYARSSRSGQFACFGIGLFIFFDDYANCLLAGESMRPLLDALFVSREKLAFIVDATAAPVASISPVSSWVGFEVDLINTEIQNIIALVGEENLTIKSSGMGVFLQSIKYRYYPIFMIVLMISLIGSKRDTGPMLLAERRTQVYKRTDGGDGKGRGADLEGATKSQPREDQPMKAWNFVVPILILVFFIFFLLVKTGEVDGEDQSIMDKIENSNSYKALLWGTMGTALVTLIGYLIQIVKDGELVLPVPSVLKELVSFRKEEDEDGPNKARFLMSVYETIESFLFGMGRIFPALIVLTLAWAVGAMMKDVGADRLFARWITGGGIAPESLPTLSFIISLFMALATGTSWGTMAIMFPLIMVPTYTASNGDETIFYATVAGILSGSVAGDHISPISDTTVLSALASDCKLLAHVGTQMPYGVAMIFISIILGTIPIGYDAWPNIVGVLLGSGVTIGFVYGLCAPVLSPTGRFDPITELILYVQARRGKESPLAQLKEDTIKAFNGTLEIAEPVKPKTLDVEHEHVITPEHPEEAVAHDDEDALSVEA